MTKIIRHRDAASFLKISFSFLCENETLNNLLIGFGMAISKGQRETDGGELFYSLVDNDIVVGCAMRTDRDRPFAISNLSTESIKKLIKKLKSDDIQLQSIVGPSINVQNFIGHYGKKTKLFLEQGVYELNRVIHPKNYNGVLRKANLDDLEICTKFINGFLIDCFEESSLEKAKKMMERILKFDDVYLWINNDNVAVSMCAKTRNGERGVAISLVFTPPEYRGRGYASNCVAKTSEIYLNNGFAICYLHTDLSNPTSNKIYEQIGYKKVGEMLHYDFLTE